MLIRTLPTTLLQINSKSFMVLKYIAMLIDMWGQFFPIFQCLPFTTENESLRYVAIFHLISCQVHLPTGAYIDFQVGENWVNIYFHASSDDWQNTLGLCGTFDGIRGNDLTHRDGQTVTIAEHSAACGDHADLCRFADSWRYSAIGNSLLFFYVGLWD